MDKYQVIDLIDNIINEMDEDQPNDLKNEPSQDPEEELDRVEDDLGGAEGEELGDYEAGDEREGEAEPEDIEELAYTMVDSTLLDQDNAYQAYFRTVMKKHDIKGIRGLSAEKRSEFFRDVSSGWKKHKKVGEQILVRGHRPTSVAYRTKSGTPVRATSMAHSVLDPSKTSRVKKWGTKERSRERIGGVSREMTEQELYEEFKQFFNYVAEQSGIGDLSVLEEEELAEFYALVHEAYEVGTALNELMQRPGAPISNPMNTYDNTIDKMKNQMRPERREAERAAARAATQNRRR